MCNKNQLDALFIHSLFRQLTSACSGHICSPSSGGIMHIYNKLVRVVLFSWLSVPSQPGQQTVNQKAQKVPICCIYTVYLLMMGYKCARNM